MNWTGGRLQRHSHNKPGSRSRRQKQHFAKARLKVQKESHQQDNTPFSSLPAWNQLPATGKGDQEHSHVPCSRESDSRYISQRRANSSEEPGRSGDSQTRKGTDGNVSGWFNYQTSYSWLTLTRSRQSTPPALLDWIFSSKSCCKRMTGLQSQSLVR